MKNKQAERLKKKRRQAKIQEKKNKIDKVFDSVNTYYENHNMPKISKDKAMMVYNKLKEVDNDVVVKTAIASLLCTLITLHKLCNFEKDDLVKYARRLQSFIKLVVESGRGIRQLVDEIDLDYKINFLEQCNDLPKLKNADISKMSTEEIRWKSTSDNYGYFLTINVYILIMDFHWTTEQIQDFINVNKNEYIQLFNNLEYRFTLKKQLFDECQIDMNLSTGSLRTYN